MSQFKCVRVVKIPVILFVEKAVTIISDDKFMNFCGRYLMKSQTNISYRFADICCSRSVKSTALRKLSALDKTRTHSYLNLERLRQVT